MKNQPTRMSKPLSRRAALAGLGGAGAISVAAAALTPGVAAAAPSLPQTTTAPAGTDQLFRAFFAAKSAHSPDRTMAFFDPANTTYADGTLGWVFPTWAALKALFEQYMPQWPPAARSYPTAILGGEYGAAVFFTNTPEEFGHEIRGIAAVDIRGGKFVRWVDYWDGRHFGVAATESLRVPAAQFPADFGESKAGQLVPATLQQTVTQLSASLARGDAQAATAVFAEDGVLEDLALHTEVVGRQSIAGYLGRALASLPYGQGAAVRHIVGGDGGGAYEWVNSASPVPRGVSAVELNAAGQITRLSSIWDGSLVQTAWLAQQMALTTEQ
jgi:ketosteroid isomerase-like protein